jgi:hypothetical protein
MKDKRIGNEDTDLPLFLSNMLRCKLTLSKTNGYFIIHQHLEIKLQSTSSTSFKYHQTPGSKSNERKAIKNAQNITKKK